MVASSTNPPPLTSAVLFSELHRRRCHCIGGFCVLWIVVHSKKKHKTHAIFTDGSTDQVLVLSGGAALSPNEATALDVAFYVSGTVGSMGTSVRGVSVFGGDLVVSGGFKVDT